MKKISLIFLCFSLLVFVPLITVEADLGDDLQNPLSTARIRVTVTEEPGWGGIEGAVVNITDPVIYSDCERCGTATDSSGMVTLTLTGVPSSPATTITVEASAVQGYAPKSVTVQVVAIATVDLEIVLSPFTGCQHPVGHLDYCRDCGPCAYGEGDCDSDGECQSGLTCVQVVGTDTCQSSTPVCPHPIGHLDYCRDCGPCSEGEGDCDNDGECQSGLTCAQVIGTDTCQASTPVCPYPVGHLDYCKDCGPCAAGEGDCDTDSECDAGLTCVQIPGTDTCQSSTPVCPHPIGHLDYCRDCGPCTAGQGDCDNDGECQSGLTCVQVVGTDTCQSSVCPHPVGHLDYCRDCGPCGVGQGDCDNDSECQSGLTCVQVTGTDTCQ